MAARLRRLRARVKKGSSVARGRRPSRRPDARRSGSLAGTMRARSRSGKIKTAAFLLAAITLACSANGTGAGAGSTSACPTPGATPNAAGQCVQVVGSYCQSDSHARRSGAARGFARPRRGQTALRARPMATARRASATWRWGSARPAGRIRCVRDEECTAKVCVCGSDDPSCAAGGAGTCGPRPDGQGCGRDEDCASGACDAAERSCGPQSAEALCARPGLPGRATATRSRPARRGDARRSRTERPARATPMRVRELRERSLRRPRHGLRVGRRMPRGGRRRRGRRRQHWRRWIARTGLSRARGAHPRTTDPSTG